MLLFDVFRYLAITNKCVLSCSFIHVITCLGCESTSKHLYMLVDIVCFVKRREGKGKKRERERRDVKQKSKKI